MKKDLKQKLEEQYSEEFWKGMKARMEMSYFKYGDVKDAKNEDAIASLLQRIEKYKETGNTEFLMDAANFAMIEFMFPKHPKAHFESTDSDQSPGRTTIYGRVHSGPNVHKHAYKSEGD